MPRSFADFRPLRTGALDERLFVSVRLFVMDDLATRLRDLIGYVPGLTLEETDEISGLGSGHTSQITRGKNRAPRVETVERLASTLGASSAYLLLGYGRAPSKRTVQGAVERARAEARKPARRRTAARA